LFAAGHKICAEGNRIIGDHHDVLQSDGRSGAGDNSVFFDFGIGGETQFLTMQGIFQFDFINRKVAADDNKNKICLSAA